MKRKNLPKILFLTFFLLILMSISSALAGSNSMPTTHLEDYTGPTPAPNNLKPAECNPIYVDEITSGSGVINGTKSNNLILGSSSNDDITVNNSGSKWLTNCIVAGAGNDEIDGSKKVEIILGGDGNDNINGGRGNDIIYGGPGNDILDGGQNDDIIYGGTGYDICYGGGGNDTFIDCEEEY